MPKKGDIGKEPAYGSNNASNICDFAIFYSTLRWPVFPCNPENKTPLVAHGFKAASLDESVIRDWWRKHPDALIGVPTGSASGLYVLDVDHMGKHPEGKGRDGFTALAEFVTKYGRLPETLTATTPNDGRHCYFHYPTDGTTLGNTASKIGQGIDTRGEGGYIIVPPSRLSNGKEYAWLLD